MTTFESMQMEGCDAYVATNIPSPLPRGPPPSPPMPIEHDLVSSTSNQYDTINYNEYQSMDPAQYNTLNHSPDADHGGAKSPTAGKQHFPLRVKS